MAPRTTASLLALLPALALAGEPAAPPGGAAIGATVERLELLDVRWRVRRGLEDLLGGEARAAVLVFTTLDCPLANRYLPRLVALEAAWRGKGVRFALVNAGPDDDLNAIAARALEAGVDFPLLKDHDAAAARALGVGHTPEAVVLDPKRVLRYRGRIDDALRPGGQLPAPTREDLREALEDVLAGRAVRVAETAVDGCALGAPAAREGPAPTFAQVAPVLQRQCLDCHRPGGQAPFPLVDFEDVAPLSEAIAEVVRDERMPPWYASPAHGAFSNRRGLSRAERDTLLRWAEAGAPRGEAPAPPGPALPPDTGWLIETPDLVLAMAAEAELPAEGLVPYRYELLPHRFEQDTWISDLQIRPSNPRVMHHANLIYLLPGEGRKPHFVTGQVPGGLPMHMPPGLGFRIPAGATLVLQIHYVTTGRVERDRIQVGLRYPRATVHKEARHAVMTERELAIPPGAPAHEVRASQTLEADVTGLALFAHMHVRGRDATFLAHKPDGTTETLLVIPAYSFDWQLSYLPQPGALRLPRGTRVECVGHYDNSPWNPWNPDPRATVRYGDQTHEEMFFGFFFYTHDQERLDLRVDPRTGHARRWW